MPEFISLLRWIRDTAYPSIVSSVTSVSNDRTAVENVAGTLDDITTVSNQAITSAGEAADSADSAALSLSQINTQVTQAENSALAAAGSAKHAQDVADEINGISAQASTLAPGSLATASYNPADGKISFGIPQGSKGDKGDNFTPNAQGLLANRVAYDGQNAGFAYLANDTGDLYFKISNTSGDWSAGFPFGKGDTGDTGEQGVGISSIARTSGDGSPGTTDTYTVTLTDATTYTFNIYNGADGQVESVAGRTGNVVLTKSDVGLSNLDNTSDLDKPISTAVQNALDLIPEQQTTPILISSQLKGSFSLSNTIKSTIFDGFLYTGNGTSQDIVTGISSVDFTVASNGSGYYHDRVAGDCIVKDDAGTIVESGSVKVNTSKVHIKSRSIINSNFIYDGIRGYSKNILTDSTAIEATSTIKLTSFTSTGFSLGIGGDVNNSGITYIAYQTLYTHIKWGLTSQGKKYIEAYNPVTNEGMIMYEGSGVAGHQIPHSMGVEIDYVEGKSLEGDHNWIATKEAGKYLILNSTNAESTSSTDYTNLTNEVIELDVGGSINAVNEAHIMYYKCKSKTWTNGTYIGTGVAGNFIETKDVNGVARKPMRVIIKRIDSTGNWAILDNKRGDDLGVYANLSISEGNFNGYFTFLPDGFTCDNGAEFNASGGVYYYEAYFDTDSDGGGAEADLPSLNTNLQVTGGVVSISNGIDANGANNEIKSITDGTLMPTGGWK